MSDPLAFSDLDVDQLVERFYAKARVHAVLGPVFAAAIGDEGWPHHLATLKDFWAGVLQAAGRYKGSPMAVHGRLPDLREEMFIPWLALFHETAGELFDPPRAALVGEKAERIARSLRLGLFYRPGAAA
jgi:hemoglobin